MLYRPIKNPVEPLKKTGLDSSPKIHPKSLELITAYMKLVFLTLGELIHQGKKLDGRMEFAQFMQF
jgi:hypothetical protein